MDFGERLRTLREERDMTREALAARLNISYSTVSKYETNVRFPDKGTLINLADFFEVSVDFLLCRSAVRETADMLLSKSGQHFLVSSPEDKYMAEEDLSQEAISEIEKFKEFVKHKYGKR